MLSSSRQRSRLLGLLTPEYFAAHRRKVEDSCSQVRANNVFILREGMAVLERGKGQVEETLDRFDRLPLTDSEKEHRRAEALAVLASLQTEEQEFQSKMTATDNAVTELLAMLDPEIKAMEDQNLLKLRELDDQTRMEAKRLIEEEDASVEASHALHCIAVLAILRSNILAYYSNLSLKRRRWMPSTAPIAL